MLTKATGLVLLPIIIAAICARRVHTRASFAIALRNLGLLIASYLVVCGWYYTRIWLKFGTPLLGNWDVISGFNWWQDPGYHVRRLPPFRTFVSNSTVQRICRICGRNVFDVVGRRFVRRGVQRECPLEPRPDGRGLLVGFSPGAFDSYRRCR